MDRRTIRLLKREVKGLKKLRKQMAGTLEEINRLEQKITEEHNERNQACNKKLHHKE